MSGAEQRVAAEAAPATSMGPLLAVAALCGGAGATTLAYLVARSAAGEHERPVLACDLGGAGLAVYAGRRTERSLPEAAARIASGAASPDGLYAELGDGLRLIASGPRLESPQAEGLERILGDARRVHALTVLDCGVPASRVALDALACATHVAWVVPASQSGLRRGAELLELLPRAEGRRELLVARADPAGGKAPVSALSRLATERCGPLVLMPEVPTLPATRLAARVDAARPALDAIECELRR